MMICDADFDELFPNTMRPTHLAMPFGNWQRPKAATLFEKPEPARPQPAKPQPPKTAAPQVRRRSRKAAMPLAKPRVPSAACLAHWEDDGGNVHAGPSRNPARRKPELEARSG